VRHAGADGPGGGDKRVLAELADIFTLWSVAECCLGEAVQVDPSG
jgi:hypothetical protein